VTNFSCGVCEEKILRDDVACLRINLNLKERKIPLAIRCWLAEVSWRVLGNSKYWFKDEELSNSDLNEAIGRYKETRPKIVISHTAPSEGAKEVLKELNGSYFLNKHGDVESRTSKALQEMFEAQQPSAWYFGHFHINREFVIGGTNFRCLAEMARFEVVSCDSSVV
jgi:hypothetical protein